MPLHQNFLSYSHTVFIAILVASAALYSASDVATAADSSRDHSVTSKLREADNMAQRGYYDCALELYDELRKQAGGCPDAVVGTANCLLAKGEYRPAISLLENNRTNDPAHHISLGIAYKSVGMYAEALLEIEAAVQAAPGNARARYMLGKLLDYLGRRNEAIDALKWFDSRITSQRELQQDAEWLTYTAMGFLRYSELTETDIVYRTKHVLQEMLQVAYGRVDTDYWPARIEAAELLRAKYNNSEHDGSVSDYMAALRINCNLPEAHVGLGHVALSAYNFEEAHRRALIALEINPNFVPAHNLMTEYLLNVKRFDEALENCRRALEVNPKDLRALSLAVASATCLGDTEKSTQLRDAIAAITPSCFELHSAVGNAIESIWQYEPAEQAYKDAIKADPTNPNARTDLGTLYMRWGEESKARETLERAWELDPYNERTCNTLDLLDMLEEFDQIESENFIIKYREDADPGLGRLASEQMEKAYPGITERYEHSPAQKTIIELFPTQNAFGIRLTGKPWIGTVGACTGRLIAMSSPRHSPDLDFGAYNFSQVLVHEFTHTVTLAATNNRIPRWLTEGLAVHEEQTPQNFSTRQMLANAVRTDTLFTLEEIDWRFVFPKKRTDVYQAYMQGEWMRDFIVEQFGNDKINRMLVGFSKGWRQDRVFREELGIEPTDFDEAFKTWAKSQASNWCFDLTPPENHHKMRALAAWNGDNASVLARLARAEFEAEHYVRALNAARKAIALDADCIQALEVVIMASPRVLEEAEKPQERDDLEEQFRSAAQHLAEVDSSGWLAPKVLAQLAMEDEDWDTAIREFTVLRTRRPEDPTSWRKLGQLYLQRDQDDLALAQLLELARIEEPDASVSTDIGLIYKRTGDLVKAQAWLGRAFNGNPFGIKLHEESGDVNMILGDTEAALRSYVMLTKLKPNEAKYFERAAVAAHKLGDKRLAQRMAKRAVALKPDSTARTLLP